MDAEIILELLQRIKVLEREVGDLKEEISKLKNSSNINTSLPQADNSFEEQSYGKKDTSRYIFKGKVYGKRKLVLAVVSDYVFSHSPITRKELKNVFDKSLQGSIGVVEEVEIAQKKSFDYYRRFFVDESDVLRLADGNMYVCTQWGIGNIKNFIDMALKLGYEIKRVGD